MSESTYTMSDYPMPTMRLSMEVPRIKHTVEMFVGDEIDKLKKHIEEQIKAATIERCEGLNLQIDVEVDLVFENALTKITEGIVLEVLSSREIHDKIEAKVRKSIEEAINLPNN
jgi:hypothetical protein